MFIIINNNIFKLIVIMMNILTLMYDTVVLFYAIQFAFTMLSQSYVISVNQRPAFDCDILHTQGDNQQWYPGQLHNTSYNRNDLEWYKYFISHRRQCLQNIQATPLYILHTNVYMYEQHYGKSILPWYNTPCIAKWKQKFKDLIMQSQESGKIYLHSL